MIVYINNKYYVSFIEKIMFYFYRYIVPLFFLINTSIRIYRGLILQIISVGGFMDGSIHYLLAIIICVFIMVGVAVYFIKLK